jgi:hypothetical protein
MVEAMNELGTAYVFGFTPAQFGVNRFWDMMTYRFDRYDGRYD